MKVVLLAPTPPPVGGIAGWTERMINAQLKNNWEVVVVDEKAIGNRQVFGKAGRINIVEEFKRNHIIWRNLKIALKDTEAKVVHSCIPSTTFAMMREYVCACITKNRKRRFIIHFRCTVPNTTKGKIGQLMLKLLCDKSDMIFSLNKQTESCLSKITKTPIRLIPNFITEDELPKERIINDQIATVLYVGGLVEEKGVCDVLKIAQRFPTISFRFVGKGDSKFEEYARTEHINNVVFTGPQNRLGVNRELAQADVFLFMTYFRGEGFSNALCEAMAAGLPCIVTDWAANKDMVGTDGGIVVKVKDVEAACKALESMKDKLTREQQSRANIEKVQNAYIEKVVANQYVEAYEEVINF